MTDEQAALEWLEKFLDEERLYTQRHHARTLKRMLAQPRLEAELNDEVKQAMRLAYDRTHGRADFILAIYRDLYALTKKPRTKTVWRVWYRKRAGEDDGWRARSAEYGNEHAARIDAGQMAENVWYRDVHVTGPHEEPA